MKKIFIDSPIHGPLYFKSIYEYFDGPKLFSAVTNSGKFLLVYWIDEDDDSYSWIAINISKHKLLELEAKKKDIFTVLSHKDIKTYFSITTYFSKGISTSVELKIGKISDSILMPDRGIFISQVEQVIADDEINSIFEHCSTFSDYSVHIDKPKTSTSIIDFRKISPVFDFIDELNSAFIAPLKLHDKLIPGLGRKGSFILDFNSDNFSLLEEKLTHLCLLMKNRRSIEGFVNDNKVPPQPLEKLLQHISNENLIIDLLNKNTNEKFLILDKSDADFYLKELQKITTLDLTSKQVPQADSLNTVFEMVDNIWQDGFIDRTRFKLDDRHILYYSEAAKILGFLNDTGSVTSLGQQLILAPEEAKLTIAAKCFENSHCGWAWITWSEVENFKELKPETAQKFLEECSSNLSESTRGRRARTLRSWCKTLQDSYRSWI